MTTKLEQLKKMTDVVADTGEIEAIKKYQPQDATTNPSLLLKAAQIPEYSELVDASVAAGKKEGGDSAQQISYAADHLAVAIGSEVLKLIPGKISTEVDARLSFDTKASIEKAHHLIDLYEKNGVDRSKVLIKLASTWEGIRAAEVLQKEGINCNLTLLFSFTQAAACADAGAYLISPFVGRILDWYKKDTGKSEYASEEDPGVLSVRHIYNFFKQHNYDTVVMGASFRNMGEIEALAGCDRLTISPALLEELSNDTGTLERKLNPENTGEKIAKPPIDESSFRFALNENAMATEKLAEGIRKFAEDQIKLEDLLKARA
ncbi:transaldolase [Marinimicrobium agarilyticum]|uniref:transaldolase n=1 Tax=Marinimicrobium agarilyticum TaxID=306546 RepID=UPI000416344F|nr:transaldolase [Marinimicrobium agarilyticum]